MKPAAAALLVSAALLACSAPPTPAPVDLLVRGGTIVDGTGGPPRIADLAVTDGRVVALGTLTNTTARRTVDATGLVVAPGFVDLHGHADLILLGHRGMQERLMAAKISQGVTTVVVGNCGLGVAPAGATAAPILAAVNGWMTPEGIEAGPMDTAAYLERLETHGVVLNTATLIPHGPVRISAMGLRAGAPDPGELGAMIEDVERGLEAGALGLSVGLIYPPGMYSATEELIGLAEVVARRDRLFTAHVRGSSETLLPATDELIEVARGSGARVHHSHLEAVGRPFWPDVTEVLAREDRARTEGLRITHDVFPYTRAATMMAAIFPPWALEGGLGALVERLRQPDTRARIQHEIENRKPEWPPWVDGGWPHNLVGAVGWDGIRIAGTASGEAETGRTLQAVADADRRHPFDVVADLMIAEGGQVGQLVGEISGSEGRLETLVEILTHPAAAIVTDAEDYGRGAPHPAHAGAFARAIRLNRQRRLMSLEQLVHRMTAYPASIAGLTDRGRIDVGLPADLTVFDPETATDRADWNTPRETAAGIRWVAINGHLVVDDGRYVGGLAGTVLRGSRDGEGPR